MIYLDILHNITLLVCLVVIHGLLIRRWDKQSARYQVLSGLLFGAVALVGMMTPVHLLPGLFFDGRSIVLSVAGLFGGPITAGVSAIIALLYRLWVGGTGVVMGVSVIVESAALGVAFHYLRPRYPPITGNLYLLAFGVLVHAGMLMLTLTLPTEAMMNALKYITGPVMLVYPPATWLICRLFLDQESRISFERALEESEAKYKAVFENAGIGIDMVDRNGKVVEVNAALSNMLEHSTEQLKGLTFAAITHPDDSEISKAKLKSLLAGEIDSYRIEKRFLKKEGDFVWADISVSALRDPKGTTIGAVGVIDDITVRKQAEEKLRDSQERLELALQGADLGMWDTDLRTGQVVINERFAEMAGFTLDELLPTHELWKKSMHPDDGQTVLEHFNKVLEGLEDLFQSEYRLLAKSGEYRWIQSRGKIVERDEQGRPLRMAGTAMDVTAKKQAEEALRASEEKYSRIVESVNEGIWSLDDQFKFTFVNKKFVDMVGYAPEEILGQPIASVLFDEDIEAQRQQVVRRRDGQIDSHQRRLKHCDGSEIWTLVSATPILDDQGKFQGTFGTVTDITRLKEAEQKLQGSEEKFSKAFRSAPVLMTLSNLDDGRYIEVNQKFCDVSGFSQAEALGRTSVELGWITPHDRMRLAQELKTCGMVNEMELTLFTKDKRELRCTYYGELLPTKDRMTILSIAHDTTERVKAQEAQIRLIAAIEQTAEGIVIMDSEGTIEFVNSGYERITGYTREEAVGKKHHFFKEDAAPCEEVRECLRKGLSWSGTLRQIHENGQEYVEEIILSPVRSPGGDIVNYVEIKRDVTKELSLQQQLLQAQKMEAVGTLAGGIAHDFNNILQVVSGYSEFLLTKLQETDGLRTDIERIHSASQRGADLVQNLMMFSRKAQLDLKPLNLNDEVRQIQRLLSRTIPKTINIALNLSEELDLVEADISQIGQLLMNLAVNARDAMPDGGTLSIRTASVWLDKEYCENLSGVHPGAFVLLEVSDSGTGIDEETLSHIFEPFFTTKGVGQGTGLGLATVYGIVKQHNGHINCYSEVGYGTTFKIYLPAVEHKLEDQIEKMETPVAGGTETILVVDDEEHIRDLVASMLESHGYEIITATNGKEALDVYVNESQKIALVILDVIMPEMDGKKCLVEILRINPNARVLISSGLSQDALAINSSFPGAKGFVAKPHDMRKMLRTVREVLDARETGETA